MANAHTFETSRMIFAPEDVIYEALTDPAQLSQWLVPEDVQMDFQSFDLRPGGRYRLVAHRSDQQRLSERSNSATVLNGRFVDLTWDQQVVHTVERDSGLPGCMRVSWRIEDQAAGSCVRVEVSELLSGLNGEALLEDIHEALVRLSKRIERLPSASIIFREARIRAC